MKILIHAEAELNPTRGKTARVLVEPDEWSAAMTSDSQALAVSATYQDPRNLGARGGLPNPIVRTLAMQLTKSEVLRLVQVAQDCKLIPYYEAIVGQEAESVLDRLLLLQEENETLKYRVNDLERAIDDARAAFAAIRAV